MYIFLLKESLMDLISSSIISKFKFYSTEGILLVKQKQIRLTFTKREYYCSQAHSRPTKLGILWDCPGFSQVIDPFSCH